MLKTRGISPKVIGPLVAPLTAFTIAKIEDPSTEALVIALIATAAAVLLPPGEVEMMPPREAIKKRVRARRAKAPVE